MCVYVGGGGCYLKKLKIALISEAASLGSLPNILKVMDLVKSLYLDNF